MLRVMILRGCSMVTEVAKGGSSSPSPGQPSSNASRCSVSKRPVRLVDVPRPRRRSEATASGTPSPGVGSAFGRAGSAELLRACLAAIVSLGMD